ncbi:MAG: carbon-nitrogen family hydrolase [bacterium]|nr:carbon-nitrogen family hydrolase [bacterium]MDY4101041.1 nitrilase-related carbon-nitrogen hydrolase [Lachnospiraceae bacterium]
MKISLCQLSIAYEKKEANTRRVIRFMEQAKTSGADLILFPEMSLTGFSMNITLTGETEAESVRRLCAEAKRIGIAVGFGWTALVEQETGAAPGGTVSEESRCADKARNSLLGENHYTVISREGEILSDYVKMHPFSYSGEDLYFAKGNQITQFDLEGIPFSGFICYDLRFPEIFQAASKRAHVIIVAADWPGSRREHWKCLLKARAIENQCYILGVNSVGDQNGLRYTGDSCVILPDGTVAEQLSEKEGMIFYELTDDTEEYRQSFPVKRDRRPQLYVKLQEGN